MKEYDSVFLIMIRLNHIGNGNRLGMFFHNEKVQWHNHGLLVWDYFSHVTTSTLVSIIKKKNNLTRKIGF